MGSNGNKGKARGYTQTGNLNADKIAFAATIRAAAGHQKNMSGICASVPEQEKFPAVRIRSIGYSLSTFYP